MSDSLVCQINPLPPPWLVNTYGIHWTGEYSLLKANGRTTVLKIWDHQAKCQWILRLTDPNHLGLTHMAQVHRFQAFLWANEVRTPLPCHARSGQTCCIHPQSGQLVEVFPFIEGRHPQPGHSEDVRSVATALARFHQVGLEYRDLLGEESLDQNHVALERLRRSVAHTLVFAKGRGYEALAQAYLSDVDRLIERIQTLRSHMVETTLHLDTGIGNLIMGADQQVWFLDCGHALRGRRIFEVVTSMYYLDHSSSVPLGESQRYRTIDPGVETVFLDSYTAICTPIWRDVETQLIPVERLLMLLHGITCWVEMFAEAVVEEELYRFQDYRHHLRAAVGL